MQYETANLIILINLIAVMLSHKKGKKEKKAD